MTVKLIQGDCLEEMQKLIKNSSENDGLFGSLKSTILSGDVLVSIFSDNKLYIM